MSLDICSICTSPRSDSAGPCSVCGAPPSAPARSLPAGTQLQNGRFTLGRILGEGGFGITYLGAHSYLKRTVAIKELFPERAMRHGTTVSVPDSQQRDFHNEKERVLEEARTIASLDSPGIVDVQDVFLENNTAYIVMEYLEGESLEERLDAMGSLSPDEVNRIAVAVCDALTEVHRRDLLHRDIKPANIMLTGDSRIVLVDFGSARAFDHGRTVRHTRILTMDYAAPEMYSTQARFGPYTDLFCLGGTLFHALTGRPPPSAMDRLQDGSVDLEFPDALQGSLSTAIYQALQVRIEDRPQSVADFKAILLNDTEFQAEIRGIRLECCASPPLGIAFHPLDDILACGGEDGWVALLSDESEKLDFEDPVCSLGFSPDGNLLAFGTSDGKIGWSNWAMGICKVFGGRWRNYGAVSGLSFNAYGVLAHGGNNGKIHFWNVQSGRLIDTFRHDDSGHIDYLAFFGNTMACSGGGLVTLWDLPTGILLNELNKHHASQINGLSFSPDGTLAILDNEDIHLLDVETNRFLGHFQHHGKWTAGCLCFSPDGRMLASGCGDNNVNLWDTVTGELWSTLYLDAHLCSLAFSPSGILACGDLGGGVTLFLDL